MTRVTHTTPHTVLRRRTFDVNTGEHREPYDPPTVTVESGFFNIMGWRARAQCEAVHEVTIASHRDVQANSRSTS